MAVDTSPGTVVMLMRLATAIKKRSTEELLGMKLRQLMLLSYLRAGAPALQQQGNALERRPAKSRKLPKAIM